MNKTKEAAFYYGAAIRYDLESDEVDLILESQSLSLDLHGIQKCASAIKDYVAENASYVPGGPVVDIEPATNKLKQQEGRN